MKLLLLIMIFALSGMADEGRFLSQAELDIKLAGLKPGGAPAAGTVHPSRRGHGLSRTFCCANCGNRESVSWEKYSGNIDQLLNEIRKAGLKADFKPRRCKTCLLSDWSRQNQSLFTENALRVPLKTGKLGAKTCLAFVFATLCASGYLW